MRKVLRAVNGAGLPQRATGTSGGVERAAQRFIEVAGGGGRYQVAVWVKGGRSVSRPRLSDFLTHGVLGRPPDQAASAPVDMSGTTMPLGKE
ncbi:MAG TPA: hypothetical protein VN667_06630 [Burkholderiales bacterium]|nr:hypothetical protein [Burkholderiales bacterium]